jgi:hypothetical protein
MPLYDLSNSTTLAQEIVVSLILSITEILIIEDHKLDSTFKEIVVSSILPITEILIIEDHKLDSTFFHVAFGSQSMLKPTSNQTGSNTN